MIEMFSTTTVFNIFAVITSVLLGIYLYFQWKFQYWRIRNIPYVAASFPFGSFSNTTEENVSLGDATEIVYKKYKATNHKAVGMFLFWKPIYLIIDIDYVKRVLTQDFEYFTDRMFYNNEGKDPLTNHLFALEGKKWRKLRTKLTSTFTSGKLKMMVPIFEQCGVQLVKAIELEILTNKPIDIKDLASRYTTDVIGSCAFGIECNSCKDPNSSFRKIANKIFTKSKLQLMQDIVTVAAPDVGKFFGIISTPPEVSKFIIDMLKETIEYRKTNNIKRNDFMQLLIELRDEGNENSITFLELAAQAYLFFIAGFETSSSTISFCLYELSKNTEMQQRVRDEVNRLSKKDGISYASLSEMKYLGYVIDETLRMYSTLPFITRKCVKEYQMPDTEYIMKKDTVVFIPAQALHYDSDYFPEPHVFDPERFNFENKSKIVPYSYIPFGDGPRNCIGARFGLIQTKIAVAMLVQNFEIFLHPKTISPLKMDPNVVLSAALGGIWLSVKKIDK